MKKTLRIACIYSVLAVSGASAQTAIPHQMRSQQALNDLTRNMTDKVGNVVYGIPMAPGEVVGDVYIDEAWNIGNVMMESGELFEGYKIRYDVKSQQLEIVSKSGVKVIDSKMLKGFVWFDGVMLQNRFFTNAGSYRLEFTPLVGMLEVLADGQVPLLKLHTLAYKKPSYNAALDVGSRDTKILKKSTLYYARGPILTEVKGKKWTDGLFGEYEDQMTKYIDTSDLSLKQESDIVTIFMQYNNLLGTGTQP